MKKSLLLLALTFSTLTFFAQGVRVNTYSPYNESAKASKVNEIPKEVQKKQYFNYNFINATLSNVDQVAFLRFNPYKNEMEFMNKDRVFYLNKIEGTEIKFPSLNKKYIVKEYDDELTYFVNLIDGKFKLLLKENIKYIAATQPVNSYQTAKSATYKRGKDEFFILDDKGKINLVPKKKKAFLNLFSSKSNEIKSFMKDRKLSHKKRKDLPKIVAYYNQL